MKPLFYLLNFVEFYSIFQNSTSKWSRLKFPFNPITTVPKISLAGVYGPLRVKAKSARIQRVKILILKDHLCV